MRRISAAVAVIALIAGAAQAQAQGNGKNNERGGGKPDAAQGGGNGGGNAERGNGGGNRGQANSGQNDGPSMAQPMRGSDRRGNGNGNATRVERGNGNGNGNGNAQRVERGNDNRANGNGNGNNTVVVDRRGNDRGDGRGTLVRVRDFASISPRGLIDGCPPGLAKKRNGCQPPGQARRDDRFGWDRPDFWGLRLGDGRYFYRDGYLLRYGSGGQFGGYIPLLGGALSIGNAWPSYYEPVALPGYYESYYGLGSYDSYRYADRAIYRVDPDTAAITSIAALLTGDDFAIGQPMPLGYDVYNVPYGYRDRYSDGPEANYRYSDGYVYQVDPTTQLIGAAIELLVS